MNNSQYFKLTDINQLYFFHSNNVRWLNVDTDYKYILENDKQAICKTNESNYDMQKVTQQIGMGQY